MSSENFQERGMGTAVVTGASSGLGRVYADRLAKRGYDLILVARRADRLKILAAELEQQTGVRVRTLIADLGNGAQLDTVVQAVQSDPAITMLVNNAGISTMGLFADSSKEVLEQTIQLNVVALTRLTLAVLPGFKSRNRGVIVNLGSRLGFQGIPYTALYSGTKGYVHSFTRTLQEELAGSSVFVQLVAPAGTATEGWDSTTVDPSIVMTAEACVDASLRGLDLGEQMTLPSLNDPKLLSDYDAATAKLFGAANTGTPAERYAASRETELVGV